MESWFHGIVQLNGWVSVIGVLVDNWKEFQLMSAITNYQKNVKGFQDKRLMRWTLSLHKSEVGVENNMSWTELNRFRDEIVKV